MFGYINLVVGLVLFAGLGAFMATAIRNNTLVRNEALGIRTKATLASDAAWRAGHEAARPYLHGVVVVGLVGAGVSLAALPFALSDGEFVQWGLYALPVVSFVIQIMMFIWSAQKANAAAKVV
ncbi:MAG: SdpI family protein [Corynebacterium sp.]|uniref:SdpI family protein n=1 Tax=Corynebacterium sp. TaxID=1720 RepID=UPI0026DD69E1|nr:SdpI family protein [Corynebacterium sp.]MDO4760790.1 SdpI family protein [Corynebacterium sp.]